MWPVRFQASDIWDTCSLNIFLPVRSVLFRSQLAKHDAVPHTCFSFLARHTPDQLSPNPAIYDRIALLLTGAGAPLVCMQEMLGTVPRDIQRAALAAWSFLVHM
jgi:hypothetical protein